ncbi:MAG: hypothetical protein FWF08_09275 [Oscillospiraceae bacterium]|nr:hypothetical protein [Oscillospiraceae bacterium]
MSDTVMNTHTLFEMIVDLFPNGNIRVFNDDGIITLVPEESRHPLELTKDEITSRLDKGWEDYKAGRGRPAEEVFRDLEKKYGI